MGLRVTLAPSVLSTAHMPMLSMLRSRAGLLAALSALCAGARALPGPARAAGAALLPVAEAGGSPWRRQAPPQPLPELLHAAHPGQRWRQRGPPPGHRAPRPARPARPPGAQPGLPQPLRRPGSRLHRGVRICIPAQAEPLEHACMLPAQRAQRGLQVRNLGCRSLCAGLGLACRQVSGESAPSCSRPRWAWRQPSACSTICSAAFQVPCRCCSVEGT